jgi:transposase
MRPVPWPEPDPVVAAAIRAKYRGRRAPLAVTMRDRLGQWLADEQFAAAFGVRGRPGWPPSRLAVVTVLQMAEDLTDRQAAEAVRTRLDWQYALGLGLAEAGFDHSVLSEFRGRVVAHGLEEVVLDALLERLVAEGLVKAGGRQRTDSTHVIAAVRAVLTLELIGESVRACLEALAAAHPAWLGQRVCVPEFTRRYGARVDSWRLPGGKAKRAELALTFARDGYALVEACYDPAAPGWLAGIPAVGTLRTVLLQNFTRSRDEQGREVIRRREAAPAGDGLPPGHLKIASPYDLDARWGAKQDTFWLGYKLHISETCDDPPACGCPPASAPSGCGHDIRPNLITHVATTDATVPDTKMTIPLCRALAGKSLAPARHYLDSGYASARQVLDADRLFGITLVTPLLTDTSAQARAGSGYDRSQFEIDYGTRTATCPQGTTSQRWYPTRGRGQDIIIVAFPATTCRPCPARQLCTSATRAGRQLTIWPREIHDLLTSGRSGQAGKDWRQDYARRAGAEGTMSQATAITRSRRTRYRGLPKTHLQHVYSAVALNLRRLDAYWNGTPLNRKRTSHLTRLNLQLAT